jgi:hypothetical protein
MNVKIGTEAVQFPEKEYINGIFLAVHNFDLCPLQIYSEAEGGWRLAPWELTAPRIEHCAATLG